ncbi:MAG: hypothetical protein HY673_08480 [Chloroflexi bacterium]|nr:hypothetical protein [Chloroflexota bacterium]
MERGSRKHILDWVAHPDFAGQLSELLRPTEATVQANDLWMPKGHDKPEEARLDRWDLQVLSTANRRDLRDWWLVHKRGANTPNWDLASTCTVQGTRGIALVEAKAHTQELKTEGKYLAPNASKNSRENHDRIGQAIAQASRALEKVVPGVSLSRDKRYQLANRIAWSWKVASLGLPVVLVYLGFLGDTDMSDVGDPFRDDEHWRRVMGEHMSGVVPEGFPERWIDCGAAPMCMVVRSRPARFP